MVRRDFLTPSTLPTETQTRCVIIPASQEWLGLMNAALLMLTQEWRYEQLNETDLTPAETAARAMLIYEEYLTGVCGVDVRQNPLNPCWLEKTYDDGVTWEVFADLSLCSVPVVASAGKLKAENVRVEGGKPQMDLGGDTWVDVVETPVKQTVPQPSPVSGADDYAKKCLASARAARAYSEAYRATFGAFAAGSLNTLGRMNNFLFDLNQALFNMIYSPHEGILESWLFDQQDFEENYEAPALTTEQEEQLTCLLLENSVLVVGSRVVFNHTAVRDNLVSTLGLNPGVALTYLFDQIGAGGTDWSGGSAILVTADCSACEETWCYEFDFAASSERADIEMPGNMTYTPGTGWRVTSATSGGSGYSWDGYARYTVPSDAVITRIETDVYVDPGEWANSNVFYWTGGESPQYPAGGPTLRGADVSVGAGGFVMHYFGAGGPGYEGGSYIRTLRLFGTGTNPFGDSNCE